jgi:hypothetical protein
LRFIHILTPHFHGNWTDAEGKQVSGDYGLSDTKGVAGMRHIHAAILSPAGGEVLWDNNLAPLHARA